MGPGMVAVIAQETARFSMFAHSLTQLDLPEGSAIRWRFGWDLADVQNALIEQMLATPEFEWIWFMGDDHAFSPDLLQKLGARDLDMVVAACLMRNPPYRPVNWVATGEPWHPYEPEEHDDRTCATCGRGLAEGEHEEKVERIDFADYPDGGLAEIAISGSAGLLVKRRVFETMAAPWFETGTGITNRVGEDVNLCRKARAAGFRIFLDLDAVLGHCTTAVVWPVREGDGWTFGFSYMGGFQVTMPPGFQSYADEVGG